MLGNILPLLIFFRPHSIANQYGIGVITRMLCSQSLVKLHRRICLFQLLLADCKLLHKLGTGIFKLINQEQVLHQQ